jgi:peroxiredoxin
MAGTAVLAAALAASVGGAGCGTLGGRRTRLPELMLERLDGGTWDLRDEAGRVVVLQFFATFDGSSLALASTLERIHVRFQPSGVSVVGVAMDPGEGHARRRVVDAFCSLANQSFEVVLASDELGRGETALGRIPTIPATVVFDRRGDPVASVTGVFREAELTALLEDLAGD